MSTKSKSDLPKEFRAQIEAERDRLADDARAAQAEIDRIAARQRSIDMLLEAYNTTPPAPKLLLLAPPEKKKTTKPKRAYHPQRAPKAKRPDKSNIEMITVALQATGKPMSGVEMRDWVRENMWPGCPSGFAAAPYGYLKDGRLVKDGLKFTLPKALGESLPVKASPKPSNVAERQPALRTPIPPVVYGGGRASGKTEASPVVDSPTVRKTFTHNGREALLSPKHWRLVLRLQKTMGKGYLPHKLCVTDALGAGYGGNAEDWLRSEQPLINSAIEQTGLVLVVEKAGVFLREIA